MPYIRAELQREEKITIERSECKTEISRWENVKGSLSYTADLSLQEVERGIKLLSSLQSSLTKDQLSVSEGGNDPSIPYFRKMDVVAREVRGPYLVPGSHKHRRQRVILANGYGSYEA